MPVETLPSPVTEDLSELEDQFALHELEQAEPLTPEEQALQDSFIHIRAELGSGAHNLRSIPAVR